MEWLRLACRPDIARRAGKVAVIVGTLLLFINHGDALLAGEVDGRRLTKILLTYVVPYAVSTYASVSALLHHQ